MTARYDTGARVLHWLVFLLLLAQVPAGIAIVSPGLEQSTIDALFIVHKGLGVVVLVAVLARLAWRLTHRPPPMPESIPSAERRIARLTHGTIYAVLIVVAVSGYVRVVGEGFPVEMLDAMGVPPLVPEMPETALTASVVHRFATFVLVGLIAIHVAEVLRHRFVLKDETLSRMWPPIGGGRTATAPGGGGEPDGAPASD